MTKAMIVSVGGSTSPLIYSLNKNQPHYVIFFASSQTQHQISEIINKLTFKLKYFNQVITDDAEKLSKCYEVLIKKLPEILKEWHISPKQIRVDYTGGTKTMSTALVLATIDYGCRYTYIGGVKRDKDGIGVVIDGEERWYIFDNPWDKLAIIERKKVNLFFNNALYNTACKTLENIINKVSKDEKPYYKIWLDILQGYEAWDKFKYKEAYHFLNKGFHNLSPVISKEPRLKKIMKHIKKNLNFLEKIRNKEDEILLIYDLLSNAERRAKIEARYDDAVARIYRAMEKIAQIKLKTYKIDNTSNVKLDKIPPTLREEFKSKYTDDNGKIRLPLYASYRLLHELNDPLGDKFFKKEKEIKSILDKRNNSKLAHGDVPIDKDTYEELLNIFLNFFEIKKREIPQFPKLNL